MPQRRQCQPALAWSSSPSQRPDRAAAMATRTDAACRIREASVSSRLELSAPHGGRSALPLVRRDPYSWSVNNAWRVVDWMLSKRAGVAVLALLRHRQKIGDSRDVFYLSSRFRKCYGFPHNPSTAKISLIPMNRRFCAGILALAAAGTLDGVRTLP